MKPGDRIELLSMPDDPDEIAPGTRGTVLSVDAFDGWKGNEWKQVVVKWDNGRSLSLCMPPDTARVIEDEPKRCRWCDEPMRDHFFDGALTMGGLVCDRPVAR
jgi:hypothetical protein